MLYTTLINMKCKTFHLAASNDSRQWREVCSVIENNNCKMESVPGSSSEQSDINSLYSDASKLRLKDAIIYLEQLLLENDLVPRESSGTIYEC